eukprot:11186081-Lingulodinium_polyedra.AAC.1
MQERVGEVAMADDDSELDEDPGPEDEQGAPTSSSSRRRCGQEAATQPLRRLHGVAWLAAPPTA